jgi:hypothetical protein
MSERVARPRAWGVLAVALALMALVVALSSTGGRRLVSTGNLGAATHDQGVRRDGAASRQTHASGGDVISTRGSPRNRAASSAHGTTRHAATRSADLTASLGLVGSRLRDTTGPPSAATPTDQAGRTAPVTGGAGSLATATTVPRDPSAATSGTSTTSSPGATSPTVGGAATGETAASRPYPGHGGFAAPAGSASYPAEGGGNVTAEATWTGTPTLALSISCPGGVSVARAGTSGLSVELDDDGGSATCEVTLSLPAGTGGGGATFTLTIEPGP